MSAPTEWSRSGIGSRENASKRPDISTELLPKFTCERYPTKGFPLPEWRPPSREAKVCFGVMREVVDPNTLTGTVTHMRVSDYVLDHSSVDWPAVLREWDWLMPSNLTVWIMNRCGDLFLVLDDTSRSKTCRMVPKCRSNGPNDVGRGSPRHCWRHRSPTEMSA
jgi:hypothetical protein